MSRGGYIQDDPIEVGFALADRWPGIDPFRVAEMDEADVNDALQRIYAEATHQRMKAGESTDPPGNRAKRDGTRPVVPISARND